MNIDIRSNIINNFKDDNKKALKEAIIDSIKEQDEVTLPGLGVFFELVWSNSNADTKNNILDILERSIKNSK